jgi:hypothetical protein
VNRRFWPDRMKELDPRVLARLQLLGLLVLLTPLFGGLHYLVTTEGPLRTEIRLVPQTVPVLVMQEVPVERIVEKIIERIVYVTPTPEPEPAPAELPVPVQLAPVPTAPIQLGPSLSQVAPGPVLTIPAPLVGGPTLLAPHLEILAEAPAAAPGRPVRTRWPRLAVWRRRAVTTPRPRC